MSAVDDLIETVSEIRQALDYLAVNELPSSVEAPLKRGIAVLSFQTVEEFLTAMGKEWALALSSSRLQRSQLPDSGMKFAARTLSVMPEYLKNQKSEVYPQILNEVSSSLSSLSGNSFMAHEVAFRWTGSNIKQDDVKEILQLLGSSNPWSELTLIWKKIGSSVPSNSQADALFRDIMGPRHDAAHQRVPDLSMPTMSSQPRPIR